MYRGQYLGHYDEYGEPRSDPYHIHCVNCGDEIFGNGGYRVGGMIYCESCIEGMHFDGGDIDEYDWSGEDERNEAV